MFHRQVGKVNEVTQFLFCFLLLFFCTRTVEASMTWHEIFNFFVCFFCLLKSCLKGRRWFFFQSSNKYAHNEHVCISVVDILQVYSGHLHCGLGQSWLGLMHLQLQSRSDLNQKFDTIIVPNASSAGIPDYTALCFKWQMTHSRMWAALSSTVDQNWAWLAFFPWIATRKCCILHPARAAGDIFAIVNGPSFTWPHFGLTWLFSACSWKLRECQAV